MNETRIKYLLTRFINNDITPAEQEELTTLVNSGEYDSSLQEEIATVYGQQPDTEYFTPESRRQLLERILSSGEATKPAVVSWRKTVLKWTAAAAVTTALFFTYNYFTATPQQSAPLAAVADTLRKEILHTATKPILTLSDGTAVTLDSATQQEMTQGNTVVKQLNGQLIYSGSRNGQAITYNTLSIPKGGQYKLVLPDGTQVWLNAASSLRFPVAFTGKERLVTLQGEAYFDVAADPGRPFRVQAGKELIEDLGTRFNVNAYADEPLIRTTLIQGAVRIRNTILKPGEQAGIDKNGQMKVTDDIDLSAVTAWKEGFFVFKNDNLSTVMRELERWYDIHITHQSATKDQEQFSGKIDRSLSLSQVMDGLRLTKANFRFEKDREIIILP